MVDLKKEIKKVVEDSTDGILSAENIDKLANSLGKALKGFVDDSQNKIVDIKDNYEGNIKEHPISSVATAFTAGIILGLLFRRN